MKKLLYFALPLILLLSCVEQYAVPLRYESSQLVVEGNISTVAPPYTIKLSYSGVFEYANVIPPALTENNAVITVTDDKGQSTTFKYQSLGNYVSENMQFRGQTGRSYTMKIALPDGRTFQSKPELMPSPVPIKKIYGEYVPNLFVRVEYGADGRHPAEPDGPTGYRIFLDTDDPANETNYYRWIGRSITRRETSGVACGFFTTCDNSCFVPTIYKDINLLSDQIINGNPIIGRKLFLVPAFVLGRMYIEVEQLNYTREAFQFWKLYQEQLTRAGTILDPLPAPIPGNVYNVANPNELALGYFSAVASFKKRLTIDVTEMPYELTRGYYSLRSGGCASTVYADRKAYPTGAWPTSPTWVSDDPNK